MKATNQKVKLRPSLLKKNHRDASGFKKIIIADLGIWQGHRPNYSKTIIRLFSQANKKIFIISSNPKAIENFITEENILGATVLKVEFNLIEKVIFKFFLILENFFNFFNLGTWFKPASILQLLQVKFLQRKNNLQDIPVFLPAVIDFMAVIPMFIRPFLFPKKWSGIYVTPWYNTDTIYSKSEKIKRAYGDRSMTLSSCQGIFVIHSDYTRYYRRLLGKNHFFAIPEPISLEVNRNYPLASEIKKRAGNKFIITLLGGIGKKRNLLLLLDAIKLVKNKNWFLVIIGKLQESDFSQSELHLINSFFKKHNEQCFIKLDGYITVEQDFNAIINATDLMYLHYHNHPFSSNQLLKAIALRKPTIVNQGGIVEAIIKEANWSSIVPYNSEAVAMNIEKLQNQFSIDEDAYTKFMQALDFKNLRTTILNQLEISNLPESGN